MTLQQILGLAGVDKKECHRARKVGMFFDWFMLIIVFWLPIKWYLQWFGVITNHDLNFSLWLVWFAFVVEVITMIYLVKRKLYYVFSNWLNPAIIFLTFPLWLEEFDHIGVLRFIRILILLRIIFPWARSAHHALTLNRAGMTLLVFIITTTLSGVLITTFDSGIQTPFEGIWWAWETVTTVGYGDVLPTTVAGKLLAMCVMVLGVVLFSLLTATISAYFVGKDRDEAIMKRLDAHEEKLLKLIERLEKLYKNNS